MIFIDTGAFIARYLQRDQYHSTALEYWGHLRLDSSRCYTSNMVISETITLLARRASPQFAVERAQKIYASRRLEILRPELADEIAAMRFVSQYADQRVSYVDCLSFVLMRKLRIEKAFTFDQHFLIAGFQTVPKDD